MAWLPFQKYNNLSNTMEQSPIALESAMGTTFESALDTAPATTFLFFKIAYPLMLSYCHALFDMMKMQVHRPRQWIEANPKPDPTNKSFIA